MSLFETGTVVMTPGIKSIMDRGTAEAEIIRDCLARHMRGDWGDLEEDDRRMNDESLVNERSGRLTDSLFSSYKTEFGDIYIITEIDRSATTVLLPEEY